MFNATEAAWLAALILGEGTIQINQRFVMITIANNDVGIINEAKRILNGNASVKLYADKREKLWKPCYVIHIWGGYQTKVEILKSLQPYLFGKKAEISRLAIELMESRLIKQAKRNGRANNGVRYDSFELARIEGIKTLNRKGV